MAHVVGRIFLLAAIVLSLSACSSEPEKQWYKPSRNYTMKDFERDQAECTKGEGLDEKCMRERGWVAITADQDKGPPPMQGGPPPARPRNAPK